MGILGKLVILPLFLLLISFFGDALAQTTTSDSPLKDRLEVKKERIETRREKIEIAKEARLAKLEAAKLRVCEGKEKVLTNRLSSLTRMTANMLEKFDAIATRVKDFYTNKVIPRGGSVANYDVLLADVDAAKANVDNALTNAKANAESFTCDGDDPKGTLTGFREDMQTVKSALGDYRTAIKDLIVAVKSSASVLRQDSKTEETE